MEKPTWISETVRFCPKRGWIKSTSCHSRKRSNMLLVRNYWPPNMDGSINPNGQFSSSSAPFSILIHSYMYMTDMFGPDIPRGRCLRAVFRFLRLRRHQCGGLLVLPPSGARTWPYSGDFQRYSRFFLVVSQYLLDSCHHLWCWLITSRLFVICKETHCRYLVSCETLANILQIPDCMACFYLYRNMSAYSPTIPRCSWYFLIMQNQNHTKKSHHIPPYTTFFVCSKIADFVKADQFAGKAIFCWWKPTFHL